MENSGIVYLKFADNQKMYGDLRFYNDNINKSSNFSTMNGRNGLGYSHSTMLIDGG